jgi:hypothetical protein
MPGQFDYLLRKIEAASFSDDPFRHIYIDEFLSPEHFEAVIGLDQIDLKPQPHTEALLESLDEMGYDIIPFPGCVTSKQEYLNWFNGRTKRTYHAATEGFGAVFRLMRFDHTVLKDLNAFLLSPELKNVLVEKFGIARPVEIDAGIQKYLHGYEISPHPDIRRKAVTWMLNVNPGSDSEDYDYHTHYLRLKPEWKFVGEFWRHNEQFDRDWLPWEWCETAKRQPANNSIVLFSPSDDTIHAVKADYDHLLSQRTQLYGNLWYELRPLQKVDFMHFDIAGSARATASHAQQRNRLRDHPLIRDLKTTPLYAFAKSLTKGRGGKESANKRHVEF